MFVIYDINRSTAITPPGIPGGTGDNGNSNRPGARAYYRNSTQVRLFLINSIFSFIRKPSSSPSGKNFAWAWNRLFSYFFLSFFYLFLLTLFLN
jgi:hypothetical protein